MVKEVPVQDQFRVNTKGEKKKTETTSYNCSQYKIITLSNI